MKKIFAISALLYFGSVSAQQTGPQPINNMRYQETSEKVNDMVHTRLDATLDYSKSQLIGKAWLTLKPHFYPTDSLRLDAKGMEIKQVAVSKAGKNTALKYTYDGLQLDIDLDRKYKGGEAYTVYIDYIAKPDEFEGEGSAAITDAKGLYFINPRGEEKDKPSQVWTQGETEASSVWIPCIDKPNQKTTQNFSLTVPAKYVTLSNGKLVSQKTNSGGTRTDNWVMELPHAPYLFFIGVGNFEIIKDAYKGKEVSYYVEKEYAPVARKIFGNTPEMMKYFSSITGVDYPWVKYSQIVGRDYVSGAMENTTATIHQESAYQDARELVDGNTWEGTIAHELFHQWFGDYVTSESWSNLTLNESFANYSEYLWEEYKYGRDAADAHHFQDMQGYLMSGSENKDLVRFHYGNKEDMFDAVSYNKGGRILHMLRAYVGDSAFFKSLNNYLTTNKFKSAEAHQLRLAFEEVTGKDLNWFWNQWYFGAGHPKLDISSSYNETAKQVTVIVKQTQAGDKLFKLPVAIDVWNGTDRMRHTVWAQHKADTFVFASVTKPSLVNFDADKVLLALKTENKSLDEYLHQYKHARNYLDRREAIDAGARKQEEIKGVELMTLGLADKYHGLRSYTIGKLDIRKEGLKAVSEPLLSELARKDEKRLVRAAAISRLGDYKKPVYASLFKSALADSSYSVSGAALEALGKIDSVGAFSEAKRLSTGKIKGRLAGAVSSAMIQYGDESAADIILGNFEAMPLSQAKFEALQPLTQFLTKVNSLDVFKRGVDAMDAFHTEIPEAYRSQLTPFVEGLFRTLQKSKSDAGQKALAEYAASKIASEQKKGF